MNVGDKVIVNFDDEDHLGIVLDPPHNGWVTVEMVRDPVGDYRHTVAPPVPQPPSHPVQVRETRVRLVEE